MAGPLNYREMANKGAVLQSAGTLLLLAMLFLVSPARVQSQSEESKLVGCAVVRIQYLLTGFQGFSQNSIHKL